MKARPLWVRLQFAAQLATTDADRRVRYYARLEVQNNAENPPRLATGEYRLCSDDAIAEVCEAE